MSNYSAKDCLDAFCARMNEKAKELGMKNSEFVDPTGIGNLSTAYDIMQLLQIAYKNPVIWQVITTDGYTANIEGADPRQYSFESKTKLGANYQCLRDHYELLGGKGGSLYTPHVYNLATIIKAEGADGNLACVVMKSVDAGDGPLNRFEATKQAVDAALQTINGQTPGDVCAQSAMVCTAADHCGNSTLLYEKNSTDVIKPASMTKLLTALIVLENISDLSTRLPVTQEMIDLLPVRFYTKDFKDGDIVSLNDLMYALMLPSSNSAAFVLGCNVGAMLLEQQTE